jgi:hypothetical protein
MKFAVKVGLGNFSPGAAMQFVILNAEDKEYCFPLGCNPDYCAVSNETIFEIGICTTAGFVATITLLSFGDWEWINVRTTECQNSSPMAQIIAGDKMPPTTKQVAAIRSAIKEGITFPSWSKAPLAPGAIEFKASPAILVWLRQEDG